MTINMSNSIEDKTTNTINMIQSIFLTMLSLTMMTTMQGNRAMSIPVSSDHLRECRRFRLII